ncbi:hypothetical protein Pmani_020735 [Petrolisthes manimaculis]|uniref:PiggyBac transposable element-derived protein domain-containing protein n=1 Tax=Petrolisthes manimaculis TaxID=1843537 RepID=A0AAE1PI37_9EUCA|nr:hypothetical protein Pmani_020735 [Petrolisthes manimaculis]
MSEARFRFLIRCLRYDDPETRQARREVDKFAAVREIWDIFLRNLANCMYPMKTSQLTNSYWDSEAAAPSVCIFPTSRPRMA